MTANKQALSDVVLSRLADWQQAVENRKAAVLETIAAGGGDYWANLDALATVYGREAPAAFIGRLRIQIAEGGPTVEEAVGFILRRALREFTNVQLSASTSLGANMIERAEKAAWAELYEKCEVWAEQLADAKQG